MGECNNIELWYELNQLAVRYWADVNRNGGQRAHEFYTEDGLFQVGDTRHSGRKTIQEFYGWRATRGARLSRHLLSNTVAEPGSTSDNAVLRGSVSLFAADGEPVLEAKPPTMIADFEAVCVRDSDHIWRFKSHVLTPLFRGEGRLNTAKREQRH